MSEASILVDDMTQAEFDAYLEGMLPKYAAEGARSVGMPLDEALEKARRQLASLLPDGHRTKGQYFKTLRLPSGETVGILWYASRLDEDPKHLFGYDIEIHEDRRGQGLGTACLRWWRGEGRRLGVDEIRLHVFAHNAGAVRLYERLGFVVTSEREGGIQMVMRLS